MTKPCTEICLCPLTGIIDLIAKKWALLIINTIGNKGTVRFKDLMTHLQGISPKTLADSLHKLVDAGLIQREAFAEIPPRVEYSLNPDGQSLRTSIVPLLQWAATRENHVKKECQPDCSKSTSHHVKR